MDSAPRSDVTKLISPPGPVVELGWIIVGEFPPYLITAIEAARQRLLSFLQQTFGEFDWRMPLQYQQRRSHREASLLLQEGVAAPCARRWDFAFIVVHQSPPSHYKAQALAMPSRTLAAAVVAMEPLLEAAMKPSARLLALTSTTLEASADKEELATVTQRLFALCCHLMGDLNGLPHSTAPASFMFSPDEPAELETMARFDEEQLELLRKELTEVADQRLEEERPYTNVARFYG